MIEVPINIKPKIVECVREVELALINKNYKSIGAESRPSSLTSDDIENAVREYVGSVTPTPENEIQELKAININGADNGVLTNDWFVDLDLYIDDKKSDLTLSLHIVTGEDGKLVGLVDNIHVL